MLIYNSCLAQRDACDLLPRAVTHIYPPSKKTVKHIQILLFLLCSNHRTQQEMWVTVDAVDSETNPETLLVLHFCFRRCFRISNRIGPTNVANQSWGTNPSVSPSLILQILWWATGFKTNTGCQNVCWNMKEKKNIFIILFVLLTRTNSNAQV